MSFGIGVGDIFAVSRLAWTVYKSCKDAPESFGHAAADTQSLEAVLREIKEAMESYRLRDEQRQRLNVILRACQDILVELQGLVSKYHKLNAQARMTWDRLRWHAEDIDGIRSRLVGQVTMLTLWFSTSQITVERKLDQLRREYETGQRDTAALSSISADSLTINEQWAWREIRKQMEEVGVTVAAFQANRDTILEWFVKAAQEGLFEDEPIVMPGTSTRTEESHRLYVEDRDELQAPETAALSMSQPRVAREQDQSEGDGCAPTTSVLKTEHRASPSNAAHKYSSTMEAAQGGQSVPSIKKLKGPNAFLKKIAFAIGGPSSALASACRSLDTNAVGSILRNERHQDLLETYQLTDCLKQALEALGPTAAKKEIAKLLIARGASLTKAIIALRDISSICILLPDLQALGADVNEIFDGGPREHKRKTSLILASQQNSVDCVSELIARGARTEIEELNGDQALHWAVRVGNIDCVKTLLDLGANPNARGCEGKSPLHYTIGPNPRLEILKHLLWAGADPNIKTTTCGGTPLLFIFAVKLYHSDRTELISLLATHGADMNAMNDEGDTALHKALYKGNLRAVQCLLAHGADPRIKNREMKDAMTLAIEADPSWDVHYGEYKYSKEEDFRRIFKDCARAARRFNEEESEQLASIFAKQKR